MKKFKNIQAIFDNLSIYLKTIEIDDETLLPKIILLFPPKWQILINKDFQNLIIDIKIDKNGNEISKVYLFNIINEDLGIDELVQYLIEIINFNEKLEKKEQLILEKIEKEKIKFEERINKIKGESVVLYEKTNHKEYIIGVDVATNDSSDFSVFKNQNGVYENMNIKSFTEPDQINVNAISDDSEHFDEQERPIRMSEPIEIKLPIDIQNNIANGLEEMKRELMRQQLEDEELENQDKNNFE